MPFINPYDDRVVKDSGKPDNKSGNNSSDNEFKHEPSFVNPFDDENNTTILENLQSSPYPVISDTPIEDRFWLSGIRDHAPSMIATLEARDYVKPGSVRQLGNTNKYVYVDNNDGQVKYFDPPKTDGVVPGVIEAAKDVADVGRDIVRGAGFGPGYIAGGTGLSGILPGMMTGQAAANTFDESAKRISGVKDLRSTGDYLANQSIEILLDGVTELGAFGVKQTALPFIKKQVISLYQQSPRLAQDFILKAQNAAKKLSTMGAIGDIPDTEKRAEMRKWQALFQGEGVDTSHGLLTGNYSDMTNERSLMKKDGSGPIMQSFGDRINEQAQNRLDRIQAHYNLWKTNPTEAGASLRGELFEDMAEGGGIVGGRQRVYVDKMKNLKAAWRDKLPENFHVSTDRLQKFLFDKIQRYNPPRSDGAMVIPSGGEGEFADFLFRELNYLKTYAPDGNIDFNRLDMMRKRVGKAFSQGYDIPNEQKKEFYFALRETMKDGLDVVDPSGGLSKKFEKYNDFVTTFKNGNEKLLKAIENKPTNEAAVQYVLGGLKNNMAASRIAEVKKYLTRPEFDYLSGLALEQLSTNNNRQFSFKFLSNNWNKLSDETKQAVFGKDQYPGLIKHLDDFAKVSGRISMWIDQTNWSNTASHQAMNRTPVTLLDPLSWSKALGEFVLRKGRKNQANLLTNKEFLNNLIEYGDIINESFQLHEAGITRRLTPSLQKKSKEIMTKFGVLSLNDSAADAWFSDAFPEEYKQFKQSINSGAK